MRASIYKHYLLGLIGLILLFNFVDRLALGIVLQDIKTDFGLSDSQLGLLSGLAFALFYAVMGIPIARWADRGNRVFIISVTTLLWTVAVALCGLAKNFLQLILIRIGAAVGEAGCFPTGFSLIADHFNRAERPRALSIYQLAGVLCALPGYLLAGWLNETYGWRVTFVVLSVPGLILAVLAFTTLREPRSLLTAESSATAHSTMSPPLKEVFRTLAANATFRHLLFAASVMSFFVYGLGQWHAAFYIRSFGLGTAEIGAYLTLVYCIGGVVGAYVGGDWPTRYAPNNERLQLKATAIGLACSGVVTILVYLAPQPHWAFTLQGIAAIGLTACYGPMYAAIQTLVPDRMRATAIALVMFFSNLVGAGLGPLAAGVLSDAFHPWAQQDSLRYALLSLSPGYVWVAWHAWCASRTVTADVSRAILDSS